MSTKTSGEHERWRDSHSRPRLAPRPRRGAPPRRRATSLSPPLSRFSFPSSPVSAWIDSLGPDKLFFFPTISHESLGTESEQSVRPSSKWFRQRVISVITNSGYGTFVQAKGHPQTLSGVMCLVKDFECSCCTQAPYSHKHSSLYDCTSLYCRASGPASARAMLRPVTTTCVYC